ncbi:MAG: TIGR00266 family protein [Planctomycetota bacterium]|nr:MAG: TIGR00266 family protein [Planctomycetota bacterium]
MSIDSGWYYVKDGKSVGPMSRDDLIRQLPAAGGPEALIYGPGLSDWVKARHVAVVAEYLGGAPGMKPPPIGRPAGRMADEIDYEIFGDDMQFVEITLDPGEVVVAEAGAMMYMTRGIQMQTVFGDPSKNQGLFGKLFEAGKRMITGESLFLTTFGAVGSQREKVAFASPYPGKIVPMDVSHLGGEVLCQKEAFLCAARGVQIDIAFQKRLGAGLFGGEGFILQRVRGDGLAFVHAGGTIIRRELGSGEQLRLDTGCLVAFQPSVDYDIQLAGGIKTSLFGGEGLFLATLTGPGNVWLQSLPFSRLAGRIVGAYGRRKDEGSLLGGIGLGSILGTDE